MSEAQNVVEFKPKNRKNMFEGLQPQHLLNIEKDAIVKLALTILKRKHSKGRALCSPKDTRDYLTLYLANKTQELFGVIYLDSRHRIIEIKDEFFGSINLASVYPRVIVQNALLHGTCAAVILYHCHPSGIPEPSQSDKNLTNQIAKALALVEIRVLDHYVVGSEGSVSFAERGYL